MPRVVEGVVATLIFLAFAAVQLNDPDPGIWVGVYGAAAAFGAAHGLGRGSRRFAYGYALACVVWALTLLPAGVHAEPRAIVTDLAMHAPGVEEAREALGLFIAGAWVFRMGVVAGRRPPPRLSAGAGSV